MDTSRSGLVTYDFKDLSDNAYDYDPHHNQGIVIEQYINPKPTAEFTRPGQSYKYCKEEDSADDTIPITLTGTPPFYLEIDIKHQSNSKPQTLKIANIDGNKYELRVPQSSLSLGSHHVHIRKIRDAHGCQQKVDIGAPHVQIHVFDVPTIYALEKQTDYCVGDRISYTLSGTPPFDIYYTFGGVQTKAKSSGTSFRRIAEKPGEFTITAIADKASQCKAKVNITKHIHEMPSVRISKGRQSVVDIHQGGQTQIQFEFWGTPPFEFTYTRSSNAKKGHKSEVLETKHDISYEHQKIIPASEEGTYEVVAIKDSFCAFSTAQPEGRKGQKLLQY
jgi:nucleoporin POM152